MAERPEDLNLPNAVVTRIIKEALPDGINVAKDAKLAISKAASVFVLYATSCANNFAMQHKRKTIAAQDVLEAMEEMEFDKFTEPLKDSLEAYKKDQKSKKDASKKKKSQEVEQDQSKEEDKENGVEEEGEEDQEENMEEEEVHEIQDSDD